ncbi:GNAT family N-acyltransferase [Halomonas binhaiensis]|uniref:GNAT family N-acetyltransferase n=1 Tax=Halomonas binhaiensis TaxID=2562282 RepID=A0A5C1NLU6_9GAMM|nr:GNAT family N-acyltransferase [Halomonas binhaiensis]QEM83125.1 GNAT family N-acetyltransferase [Halomonas binhaiensis]
MSQNTRAEERHVKGEQLCKRFAKEFRCSLAESDHDRQRVYALRHQIYLGEMHCNLPEDPEKRLESDEFDQHALHCMIEHRESGQLAGCMRLVIPHPDQDNRMPVVHVAGPQFTRPELHPSLFPSTTICEISRLAVAPSFRKRAVTFPLVMIGLFLSSSALAGLTHRRNIYALMEPRLPRLLAQSGFRFHTVSEGIHYYGIRHAYYIDHVQAEQEMHHELDDLYQYIRGLLADQLQARASVTGERQKDPHSCSDQVLELAQPPSQIP